MAELGSTGQLENILGGEGSLVDSGIGKLRELMNLYYKTETYGRRFEVYGPTINEAQLVVELMQNSWENRVLANGRRAKKKAVDFEVVDYGGGDGRIWRGTTPEGQSFTNSLLREHGAIDNVLDIFLGFLANKSRKNIALQITNIELSDGALEMQMAALSKQGFTKINKFEELETSGYRGKVIAIWEKGFDKSKISFKLVLANPLIYTTSREPLCTTSSRLYIEGLGAAESKTDVLIAMFGSLAYYTYAEDRINTLRLMNYTLANTGLALINVPTAKLFKEELKTYDSLRERATHARNADSDHSVQDSARAWADALRKDLCEEPGTLAYVRKIGGQNRRFSYQTFTIEQLVEELGSAGFNVLETGASSILHPSALTRYQSNEGIAEALYDLSESQKLSGAYDPKKDMGDRNSKINQGAYIYATVKKGNER